MFENISLEISLKPFKNTDTAFLCGVCAKIFDQWRPLLKNRRTVSVMLWVGDGSEILDYAGDMKDTFEWCRFIGTANLPYRSENEPLEISLHSRKQDYMPDAPVMTYGILKTIVSCLKEEGKKALPGVDIRVGETFDIGPEFAISDFKYVRHPEICSGTKLDSFGFVDATAQLNGDDRRYAAYPDGIPDGTRFGTFLGKQSEIFLKDMDFDYLWLSNGLGYSADPWKVTGKIYDGEHFYPEKLADTKEKVFAFWKLFREACPDIPLETRGTNNSVGIDYASDGVPLYDIYKAGLNITPPPNSPWAALNDNFGLEMMGHMTRICELPGDRFPFRYYLHDPWWVNSPWYDRYDNSPCDIYLPMAISRINADGAVESANSLNILSIDNSYGGLPDCCANEVIPHLLKAEKNSADAPAPVVWVYPMREYTTTDEETLLKEMHTGDNFICSAINDGFPLCCVASSDSFINHNIEVYRGSVLLSAYPTEKKLFDKLADFASNGIPVIIYSLPSKIDAQPLPEGMLFVDMTGEPSALRKALAECGYYVAFNKKSDGTKPPTLAVSKYDNAFMFSVYNANTTTDACFRFPLGAPVLCGMETEIKDGCSVYRFSRGEQRECRMFVEQEDGVISCREAPPVNARFRRAIKIRGLKNAAVRLFAEKGCECAVSVSSSTDVTPVFDERFRLIHDAANGDHLEAFNVSGDIYFLIGHKGSIQA